MAKNNKIPKNKSINEMLGQKEQKVDEETITMEEVIAKMDREKQEKAKQTKQARKQFTKKIQDMARRARGKIKSLKHTTFERRKKCQQTKTD